MNIDDKSPGELEAALHELRKSNNHEMHKVADAIKALEKKMEKYVWYMSKTGRGSKDS